MTALRADSDLQTEVVGHRETAVCGTAALVSRYGGPERKRQGQILSIVGEVIKGLRPVKLHVRVNSSFYFI